MKKQPIQLNIWREHAEVTFSIDTQEAFLGPGPTRTPESELSIVILNRKSGPQSLGQPGSQKILLGIG